MDITAPDLTVLFFAVVCALGVALVWLFCELERYVAPQIAPSRRSDRDARD